jgi:hypothetical protein
LLDRAADLDLLAPADVPAQLLLVERALLAPDAGDARLAAWVRSGALREDEALLRVAVADRAGPETARALLPLVEDAYPPSRAAIYRAAGAKLVARPGQAVPLWQGLEDLSGDDRAESALHLLAVPDASPAFAVAVLWGIDDFYGDDRGEVYRRAAPAALRAGEEALLVRAAVEEFHGDDRIETATWLLALPGTTPEVVAGLARQLGEFYGDDRWALLDAHQACPAFRGDAQREVVRAAAEEFDGEERSRALARIAAAPALDASGRSLLDLVRRR